MGTKIGRPTKCTESVINTICEYISQGNFIEIACQAAGVNTSTYCEWKNKGEAGIEPYAEFAKAVLEAEAEAERKWVERITDIGMSEDPKLLQWVLERKHQNRWNKEQKINQEISGKDGQPIQINIPVITIKEEE